MIKGHKSSLEDFIEADYNVISLDAPIEANNGRQRLLIDSVYNPNDNPEETAVKKERRRLIAELVEKLGPEYKEIIKMKFGIGDGIEKTYSHIGKINGFSMEKARYMVLEGLEQLKKSASENPVYRLIWIESCQ